MEKEKKNKKQVIIGISILLLVTLLLLGLTYAYYRTRIVGNSNSESISVTSKNLEVTYKDGSASFVTGTVDASHTKFTKEFSVENTGNATASYSIILDKKENGFTRSEDWTYKLYKGEEKTQPISQGTIAVGSEQIIYGNDEVDDKQTNTYTLEIEYDYLSDIDQSEDMGATLSFRVNIGEEKVTWDNAQAGTLLNAIKTNTQEMQKKPDTIPGKEASLSTEKVLATTEDDYGTSHYFRGNVDNNYLNFGNMCWRIVRVQGDGSIKIVLADKNNECTHSNVEEYGGLSFNSQFTDSFNTPDAVTYSSGPIPAKLESWVKESNLKDNVNIKNDAEWCIDISIYSVDSSSDIMYYGAYGRLATSSGAGPNLKCNFTGLSESKSIKYTSGYALLTADELAFVGSSKSGSSSHFLSDSPWDGWWTLSPESFKYGSDPYIWESTNSGSLTSENGGTSYNSVGVRPALVLKSDVKVAESGNGTKETPYVVQ